MAHNGFCLIYHCHEKIISRLENTFQGSGIIMDLAYLWVGENTPLKTYSFTNGTAYLIGNIHNLDSLIHLAGQFEGQAHNINHAALLYILRKQLGDNVLALAEGDFCFIPQEKNSPLIVLTDPRGLKPVYLVQTDEIWLTDRLRFVGTLKGKRVFDFYHPGQVCQETTTRSENYLPIKNAQRLRPGSLNILSPGTLAAPLCESRKLAPTGGDAPLMLSRESLLPLIERYLDTPIAALAANNQFLGIPLSGGLDSSLVTALATRHSMMRSIRYWQ